MLTVRHVSTGTSRAHQVVCDRYRAILPGPAEVRRGRLINGQLLRAGTSVGADYRALCRPRSDADFIAKVGTVIEECDETVFWLELVVDVQLAPLTAVAGLINEADELTRIFVAARETVRSRLRQQKRLKRA